MHTSLEARHHLGLSHDLYLLPVSTYFVPVVYAALNFGIEGALPTALWCVALVAPNVALWHTPAERPAVILELVILVVMAVVIARRVDLETAARNRAESASELLERLNRTAAASAQSLDLASVLSRTLEAMLDPHRSQRAWVLLGADGEHEERLICASSGEAASEVGSTELAVTRALLDGPPRAAELTQRTDGAATTRYVLSPLPAPGAPTGAISLASEDRDLSPSDSQLVEAAANHLGMALDNIRHLRQAEVMVGELSRAQRELEDYVRLATDAQEEERRRLARELHDDTIQALVIAKGELEVLRAVELPLSPAAGERVARVDAILAGAIDDVRRFSRDLRPSLLDDLGLVQAIDWLVGEFGARASVSAQLRVGGEPRRLDPRQELAVFRIVQEALRNVERHAAARNVTVELHFGSGLEVLIADDGRGFESSRRFDHSASPHLGLAGMRERARLAGASLGIESRPGRGRESRCRSTAEDGPAPRSATGVRRRGRASKRRDGSTDSGAEPQRPARLKTWARRPSGASRPRNRSISSGEKGRHEAAGFCLDTCPPLEPENSIASAGTRPLGAPHERAAADVDGEQTVMFYSFRAVRF